MLLKQELRSILARAAETIAEGASLPDFDVSRTKTAEHGDFATNLAMQMARPMRRNPRQLAESLVAALPESSVIERVEIAGPGFINIFLTAAARRGIVRKVLAEGELFGCGTIGSGKKMMVEYVSANPTGPLHVGHGRGAAYGASLANVLAAAGFDVYREYYVNDAGRQMDILAACTWLRYLELLGEKVVFPPKGYQGDYVRTMAAEIERNHGRRYHRPVAPEISTGPADPDDEAAQEARLDILIAAAKAALGDDYAYIHGFALTEQLGDCRNDLAEFGVHFDNWFSEQSLHESGMVAQALEVLEQAGHLYTQDAALWFRATAFGDEKDRVVRRENGQYTYFAADIAYHLNKFQRGFDSVVNVWGADHHGYVQRLKGAIQALGLEPGRLEVALVQFAVLYREGVKVPMSTRKGDYVTLRQLREEVGNDAARFFYVMRRSEQHLDFDLDLARSQSNENPVYYIQYAHARVCSVLEQWQGYVQDLADVDLLPLDSAAEFALLQKIEDYPATVELAANERAPHAIAHYLRELAGLFHSYYNATHILVENEAARDARLALAVAVRQVLAGGLSLLGVTAPTRM